MRFSSDVIDDFKKLILLASSSADSTSPNGAHILPLPMVGALLAGQVWWDLLSMSAQVA